MACMGSLAKLSSDHAIDAGTAMGLGHFVTMFKDHVAGACSRSTHSLPALAVCAMNVAIIERFGA